LKKKKEDSDPKKQKETRRVEIESCVDPFPTKTTFMEIEKGVRKGHVNNQHTRVVVLCE